MKHFIVFIIVLFLFSCGGSGGGSYINTNPSGKDLTNEKALSTATADNVTKDFSEIPELQNSEVIVDDTESNNPLEISSSNYAYTYSTNGIIVKIPIPEKAKQPIDVKDLSDNLTVNDLINENNNNVQPPYVVGETKPLYKVPKKPICSVGNSICLVIDLSQLKKDLTVAVVPYETLLSVPDNGVDALKDGYVPLTGFSAAIHVENPFGQEYSIQDLEKVFTNDNTTVTIYLKIPYNKDLEKIFNDNKTYKIYLITKNNGIPQYTPVSDNLTIVQYNKDNVVLKALYTGKHGFYPFVIARKMDPKKMRKIQGDFSDAQTNILKNVPIVIEACSEDSTVENNNLKDCSIISVGKVLDNGSYSFTYEKPDNKKVFAKFVSNYLKEPIILEVNDNDSLVLPPDKIIRKSNYPSLNDLDGFDYNILSYIVTSLKGFYCGSDTNCNEENFDKENYDWGNPFFVNLNYFLDPSSFVDVMVVSDNYTEYQEVFKNFIIDFLNNKIEKSEEINKNYKNNEYSNDNCYYSLSIEKDKTLTFKASCSGSYSYSSYSKAVSAGAIVKSGEDTENYSIKDSYSYTKVLNIKKLDDSNFSLEFNENYNSTTIEKDMEKQSYSGVYQAKWLLNVNNNGNEIFNHSASFSESVKENSGEYFNEVGSESFYKKDNQYYYLKKANFSAMYIEGEKENYEGEEENNYNECNYSLNLNFDATVIKKVNQDNNTENKIISGKIKINDLNFKSKTKVYSNIKSGDVFNILENDGTIYLNKEKFENYTPVYSFENSLCE